MFKDQIIVTNEHDSTELSLECKNEPHYLKLNDSVECSKDQESTKDQPLFTVEQVLSEIDSIIEQQQKQQEQQVRLYFIKI